MNSNDAKIILSAYRPSGKDAYNPEISEAMQQARQDPSLDAWFKQEVELDAVFARQLQSVPVPPDLRAKILAGLKTADPDPAEAKPWYYGKWLPLAAAILLIAGIAGFWMQSARNTGLSGWQTGSLGTISSILAGKTEFDQASPDVSKLQAWLRERNAPAPQALPASLQSLASLGCKTITWEGRPVSIICFNLGNDNAVHLVILDRAGLQNTPPENHPRFVQEGDWITASWSEGNKAMMLTTKGDRKDLEKFFL